MRYEQFLVEAKEKWKELKVNEPELECTDMDMSRHLLLSKVLKGYEERPTHFVRQIYSATKMQHNTSVKLDNEAEEYYFTLLYVLEKELNFREKEGI